MKLILSMLLIESVYASEILSSSLIHLKKNVVVVRHNCALAKNKNSIFHFSFPTRGQKRNHLQRPFVSNTKCHSGTHVSSFIAPTTISRIRGKSNCSSFHLFSKSLRNSHQGWQKKKKNRSSQNFYYQNQFQSTLSSSSSSSLSTTPPTTQTNASSNYITTKSKADTFHNQIDQESNSIDYPKGIPDGFYIIKQYHMPDVDTINDMIQNAIEKFDQQRNNDNNENEKVGLTQMELDRLGISNDGNLTLPIALMLLDPIEYPSFSKARKACRKGYIIIHRGPLDGEGSQIDNDDDNIISDEEDITFAHKDDENDDSDEEGTSNNENQKNAFNLDKCIRGRVGDRVYPHDVIGKQVRMHGGFYPGLDTNKPPFDLPVVYEDDHFAIVNKPAGIVVYSQRKQGHGMMTVRAALPFALRPPKRGTLAIIRRPVSVHRLDKPTAGLLLIAKTKPAMVDITRQFVERRVKKTYTAILNGIPDEPIESSITTLDAHELGVDVGDLSSMTEKELNDRIWQLIDSPLDDGNSVKSAVTVWRPLEYIKSLKANNGILTKVEMKPKTGRYHQLRRHMVSYILTSSNEVEYV